MSFATAAVRVQYRPMLESDFPAAHALSQAVHWRHRAEDWQLLHYLGSGFVAECDGDVIGTALWWPHGDDHASLGMVIVSPEAQGRGIGGELMNRLLEAIGERNTLLHATPAGQPLYEKLGFEVIGRVYQHQGAVVPRTPVAPPQGTRLRSAEAGDGVALAELASRAAGMARTRVVNELLRTAEGVVIEDDNGNPVGFGILRSFGQGDIIGPVVAPDAEHARALLSHLAAKRTGAFVRIDMCDEHGLDSLLSELGLAHVDTPVAMIRGEPQQADLGIRQFAIASQAFF
ncbi:ribosomal protein S18 acetylase RimI-like enzyme [Halomonas ventosae]|uniref:Ribosomal protein S18 acetylase RimI-like enzyme n=1 Tax=Halomonas ventosae TaxID=229007 RepID=A0A4R6ZIQ8_9GAMM|nr:GNAT family N-acetyltransferase [Halomonas ventosae]TDR52065.1 ribosomal protein S18 acetylase RimI-like enzyme [Halomonas ventosae]